MVDEPPALTLESGASKVLLRLWRGDRYVHHEAPVTTTADFEEMYVQTVAAVTAHLALRLGHRVHIVAGPGSGSLAAIHRSLRSTMPGASIDIPHEVPSYELPLAERRPSPDRSALIAVSGPLEFPLGQVDVLIVVVPTGGIDARHFAYYVTNGSQLLICGHDRWASALHLADVGPSEVPIDVLIAGGAFG